MITTVIQNRPNNKFIAKLIARYENEKYKREKTA